MTWLVPVLALLALSAILGATQDIGSDGVYVTTLPPKDMAKYTGFQSMCWNAGFLLAAGPLIHFSGVLHEHTGNWGTSWMVILLIVAGHHGAGRALPWPPAAAGRCGAGRAQELRPGDGHLRPRFCDLLPKERRAVCMVAFAFFYRSGFGLIDKMGPLFMIDDRAKGGLGLSNQMLGDINGTFGTGALSSARSSAGGSYRARG